MLLAPLVLPRLMTSAAEPVAAPVPMLSVWVLVVATAALPILIVLVTVDRPRVMMPAPVWPVPPIIIGAVVLAVPMLIAPVVSAAAKFTVPVVTPVPMVMVAPAAPDKMKLVPTFSAMVLVLDVL